MLTLIRSVTAIGPLVFEFSPTSSSASYYALKEGWTFANCLLVCYAYGEVVTLILNLCFYEL